MTKKTTREDYWSRGPRCAHGVYTEYFGCWSCIENERRAKRPHYKWNADLGVWSLTSASRPHTPLDTPSYLLPALPRVDRFHLERVRRI